MRVQGEHLRAPAGQHERNRIHARTHIQHNLGAQIARQILQDPGIFKGPRSVGWKEAKLRSRFIDHGAQRQRIIRHRGSSG